MRGWLIAIIVLLLALIIWLFAQLGSGGGEQFVSNFSVEEHRIAWMGVSNTFAEPDLDPDWEYRAGLLMQLGHYESADARDFQGVHLKHEGEIVATYCKAGALPELCSGSTFTWINIVGDDGSSSVPMNPEHAFYLYPNDRPYGIDAGTCVAGKCTEPEQMEGADCTADSDCDATNRCATIKPCDGRDCLCNPQVSSCDDPGQLQLIDSHCVRGNKLHAYHNVEALVTFWQGKTGYALKAKQLEQQGELVHNQYEFSFLDDFKVSVFQADTTSWTMTELAAYAQGAIDHIEVIGGPITGPHHGDHEDPAWPGRP